MSIQLSQIASWTGAKLLGPDRSVRVFATDSRSIHHPSACLFIALTGQRHDGHDYIPTLKRVGVKAFMVSGPVQIEEGISYLLVEDSREAFQTMAAAHRALFDYPVIGITGSYGKTMVKDLLVQYLNQEHYVVSSPRSFNSQIGVPLSLMGMAEQHELGIFEAGISQVGEMQNLAQMIAPDIAVFTAIGQAHEEGFESTEQKIQEKLKLFEGAKIIVYPRDIESIHAQVIRQFGDTDTLLMSWGHREDAAVHIVSHQDQGHVQVLNYCTGGASHELKAISRGGTDFINLMHLLCTLLALGKTADEIQARLGAEALREHRASLSSSLYAKGVMTDPRPLNGPSIRTSIDRLKAATGQQKVQVMLVESSGHVGNDKRVEELRSNLDDVEVICIGSGLQMLSEHLPASQFIPDLESFINSPESYVDASAALLLTGNWSVDLIRLRSCLERQTHQTEVRVNLQAIEHNLNCYREILPPGTALMAMVKAHAYGSGHGEVARILQYHQVDYLTVAYPDEGAELRRAGVHLPIMVMNASAPEFGEMIRLRLEPEIYSLTQLKAFVAKAQELGQEAYPIHVKFDTGMNRLGLKASDAEALRQTLSTSGAVQVRSVFTHLFASDAQDGELSLKQLQAFEQIKAYCSTWAGAQVLYHALNTSGISRFPEHAHDMVRLGIGLYGYTGDPHFSDRLRPVISWHSVISQIKAVDKGETVGYGGVLRLEEDTLVGIIPVGYADGLRRAMGNGQSGVYVRDQYCPFIGNICMDMSMIDLSALTDIKAGEAVELIGERMRIERVASSINTIPYEILTSIPPRVKRNYIFKG